MPLPIVGLGWQPTDGEYPEKPAAVLTEPRGLSLPVPQ